MYTLTVIIPVYNSSAYLEQCLDSVIHQTLQEMEIICVNDGSTDNSGEILKQYALRDKRIKIVTKENGGLSSARNAGYKQATGEIITFLDSDDWIYSKDSYEILLKKVVDNNLDLIAFEHQEYAENMNYMVAKDQRQYVFKFDEEDYEKVLLKEDFSKYTFRFTPFAWNKFYRKSFLDKNEISFCEELMFGEDSPYALHSILKAERIMLTSESHIVYRVNNAASMTNTRIHRYLDSPIKVSQEILRILNKYNLFEEYKTNFIISSIYRLLGHYLKQTYIGAERESYLSLVADFFNTLTINKEILKAISEKDEQARIILFKNLPDYPLTIIYKLFGIPICRIVYKANSKKIYIIGIPLLKIFKKGTHSYDLYILGGLIKIIKSVSI